jgi:hypothetical protein
MLKITAFWDIAPYSLVEADRRFRSTVRTASVITLMMEAVCTSVYFNETTRRYIPGDCHLHTRHREKQENGIGKVSDLCQGRLLLS